jgi:5-carboxymethyl-2-hydroxymuconate isomerase
VGSQQSKQHWLFATVNTKNNSNSQELYSTLRNLIFGNGIFSILDIKQRIGCHNFVQDGGHGESKRSYTFSFVILNVNGKSKLVKNDGKIIYICFLNP